MRISDWSSDVCSSDLNEEVVHTVVQYPYNIREQKDIILNTLATMGNMNFEDVLLLCKDKIQLVYNFLALLEMIQQQLIVLSLGLGYNNFRVTLRESPDRKSDV